MAKINCWYVSDIHVVCHYHLIPIDYQEPKYLTTIFLKQLKEIATGLLRPQVIQSVVVAIPVSFRTEQCDMMKAILREVFAEANVIVDTITEHSAAAIAYKFTKEVSNEQEKILLVDLGGGMLDISCITLIWTDDKKPDALKVGQTESDPRVGGRYFTDRLVEHFEGQLGFIFSSHRRPRCLTLFTRQFHPFDHD